MLLLFLSLFTAEPDPGQVEFFVDRCEATKVIYMRLLKEDYERLVKTQTKENRFAVRRELGRMRAIIRDVKEDRKMPIAVLDADLLKSPGHSGIFWPTTEVGVIEVVDEKFMVATIYGSKVCVEGLEPDRLKGIGPFDPADPLRASSEIFTGRTSIYTVLPAQEVGSHGTILRIKPEPREFDEAAEKLFEERHPKKIKG